MYKKINLQSYRSVTNTEQNKKMCTPHNHKHDNESMQKSDNGKKNLHNFVFDLVSMILDIEETMQNNKQAIKN